MEPAFQEAGREIQISVLAYSLPTDLLEDVPGMLDQLLLDGR